MNETGKPARLGISGRLAARFQANPLTPILAIIGLLLGLLAVAITPREEEPQIDVTMANVIVPFDGASARDVEQLVSTPLEQKLAEPYRFTVYGADDSGTAVNFGVLTTYRQTWRPLGYQAGRLVETVKT